MCNNKIDGANAELGKSSSGVGCLEFQILNDRVCGILNGGLSHVYNQVVKRSVIPVYFEIVPDQAF